MLTNWYPVSVDNRFSLALISLIEVPGRLARERDSGRGGNSCKQEDALVSRDLRPLYCQGPSGSSRTGGRIVSTQPVR
jgi:hypothetical protein